MDGTAPTFPGALAPRLPGRLTPELILRSPQYMSCINLYHLDLRGVIDNATQPADCAALPNQTVHVYVVASFVICFTVWDRFNHPFQKRVL
jgi:hypothetical protein